MRTFVRASASISLGQLDEFEQEVVQAVRGGVPKEDLMELLFELADLGITVPAQALKVVEEL